MKRSEQDIRFQWDLTKIYPDTAAWETAMQEAEAALAPEVPIDTAVVAGDAGDVTADLLLNGGRPGHELEAEAIVDHGEAA